MFKKADQITKAIRMLQDFVDNVRSKKSKEGRHLQYKKKAQLQQEVKDTFYNTHARHYEVLGLPKTASQNDVHAAYKRLALEWHPDRYAGKDVNIQYARDKFAAVQTAFETLTENWEDRKKKKLDDDINAQYKLEGSKASFLLKGR